mgnify:CR=1 FL=1
MSAAEERWVLYPVCGAKTRLRLRQISSAIHKKSPADSLREIFIHICVMC